MLAEQVREFAREFAGEFGLFVRTVLVVDPIIAGWKMQRPSSSPKAGIAWQILRQMFFDQIQRRLAGWIADV